MEKRYKLYRTMSQTDRQNVKKGIEFWWNKKVKIETRHYLKNTHGRFVKTFSLKTSHSLSLSSTGLQDMRCTSDVQSLIGSGCPRIISFNPSSSASPARQEVQEEQTKVLVAITSPPPLICHCVQTFCWKVYFCCQCQRKLPTNNFKNINISELWLHFGSSALRENLRGWGLL